MAPQQTENGSITAANNSEVWTLNQHLKEADPEVYSRICDEKQRQLK